MQERTHAFAMKSQIWLLDPRPNLPGIVAAVEHGFELSEASNTPVMLELRIRACHVHGRFIGKDNQPPALPARPRAGSSRGATRSRIVLPPASLRARAGEDDEALARRGRFIRAHRLNEMFAGDAEDIGIVLQGGMYNGVMRALAAARAGRRLRRHARSAVRAERDLSAGRRRGRCVLRRQAARCWWSRKASPTSSSRRCTPSCAGPTCRRSSHGKDVLPMARRIHRRRCWSPGCAAFLEAHAPALLPASRARRRVRPRCWPMRE